MAVLKVMAYNIWEGVGLGAVASAIRAKQPDIALLSEVRWYIYWRNPVPVAGPRPTLDYDQAAFLARYTYMPYYEYRRTGITGIRGTKGLAILSRYPLLQTSMHPVKVDGKDAGFPGLGSLRATIRIGGLDHQIFSTRFQPQHTPEDERLNRLGHVQAMDYVRGLPGPVIFGGDLNAKWEGEYGKQWARDFRDRSGLSEVMVQHPDPSVPRDLGQRDDYIYYRGPYKVSWAEMRDGSPGASDHPYVFAELTRTDVPVEPPGGGGGGVPPERPPPPPRPRPPGTQEP